MKQATGWVIPVFFCLTPGPIFGEGISIDHHAVGCVVAERFPQFEARLEPADRLGRARLHFQPEGSRYWYSVAMTREGDRFRAVTPKPRRSLKGFSYYVEAIDLEFVASRTQEYATRVVGGPAECEPSLLAAVASAASVVVEAPAGAPAIPAGFAATGVSTTVAATGAAAGAAAGGGPSLGLVLGVVGGAAAVGAVAVAARGGGGPTSTASTMPSTPAVTPTPAPTPSPSDVTGRWLGTSPDGTFQTAGGCAGQQQDLLLVLTQTGANVTGTFDSTVRVAAAGCTPLGAHELGTLSGTAAAGTLSFTATFTQPPSLVGATEVGTGTITANRMSGTYQVVTGNGAGTWSVNRQ